MYEKVIVIALFFVAFMVCFDFEAYAEIGETTETIGEVIKELCTNEEEIDANEKENEINEEDDCEEKMDETEINRVGFDEFDFTEIDEITRKNGSSVSFSEIVLNIIGGDDNIFANIVNTVKSSFFSEISINKRNIIKIIILAIFTGLISNISVSINSKMSDEMGFYIVYLMIVATLLGSFFIIYNVVVDLLNCIMRFMVCLIPAFFIAVGMNNGYTTSTAMSTATLAGITFIEAFFTKILLPLVCVYVSISLVNCITNESYFDKAGGTIEEFQKWSTRTILTVFIGLNIIEGIILPSKNTFVTRGVTKLASAVPVVGNTVNGVAELAVSSGEIIKNSIGGGAMITLVLIAAVPVVKVVAFIFTYKITEILVEPVCDKRITRAIDCVVHATSMLYRIVICALLMFIASIAIVCVVTKK